MKKGCVSNSLTVRLSYFLIKAHEHGNDIKYRTVEHEVLAEIGNTVFVYV